LSHSKKKSLFNDRLFYYFSINRLILANYLIYLPRYFEKQHENNNLTLTKKFKQ